MNDADTIASLAREGAHKPEILKTNDGREILVLPEGFERHDVPDEHGLKRTAPSYLKQDVTLQTVDSLADYVNRFKIAETVLFADIAASSICAVLDFHTASSGDMAPYVQRCAHRATMQLPFSEEWSIWKAASGHLKPQLEFARFLEENGGDVGAPSGADLLEACRDIQARRNVNFIQAVRTASENESFEYTDNTEARAKGEIEIPTKFQLAIPIYFGELTSELFAFLRWKLDEGKMLLGIQLHRAEHVRQAVFKQIVLRVADATQCPIVFGKAG
jgi:uncharacterized protein YfdQ (DUF2303 family)